MEQAVRKIKVRAMIRFIESPSQKWTGAELKSSRCCQNNGNLGSLKSDYGVAVGVGVSLAVGVVDGASSVFVAVGVIVAVFVGAGDADAL